MRHTLVQFPSTRWSLVARAAGAAGEAERRLALEELLRRYLRPLRMYLVRTRGIAPGQAEDLLQEFVMGKVLEEELIASADRGRGKFRTFLLTSLNRFAADQRRHEARAKRGGADTMVALDEAANAVDPSADPGVLFDAEWARAVVADAVGRMRRECDEDGRADLWVVFETRLLAPALDGAVPVPYRELARRLGWASEQRGPNLLLTVKRLFRRSLRSAVGDYAEDERDIDAEIAELERLLAGGKC